MSLVSRNLRQASIGFLFHRLALNIGYQDWMYKPNVTVSTTVLSQVRELEICLMMSGLPEVSVASLDCQVICEALKSRKPGSSVELRIICPDLDEEGLERALSSAAWTYILTSLGRVSNWGAGLVLYALRTDQFDRINLCTRLLEAFRASVDCQPMFSYEHQDCAPSVWRRLALGGATPKETLPFPNVPIQSRPRAGRSMAQEVLQWPARVARLEMTGLELGSSQVIAAIKACQETLFSLTLADFSAFGFMWPSQRQALPALRYLKLHRIADDLVERLLGCLQPTELRVFEYENLPKTRFSVGLAGHFLKIAGENPGLQRMVVHVKSKPTVWYNDAPFFHTLYEGLAIRQRRVSFEFTYFGSLWEADCAPARSYAHGLTAMYLQLNRTHGENTHGIVAQETYTGLRNLSILLPEGDQSLTSLQAVFRRLDMPLLRKLRVDIPDPECWPYVDAIIEVLPRLVSLTNLSVGVIMEEEEDTERESLREEAQQKLEEACDSLGVRLQFGETHRIVPATQGMWRYVRGV